MWAPWRLQGTHCDSFKALSCGVRLHWNQNTQLLFISLFSLWYEEKKKQPPGSLPSLHPPAPTALALVCAFFMFCIQRLCTGLVLEMLVFPLIPSNWDTIGYSSGRGRVNGRDKNHSAHALLLVFNVLITGTMLSDFHLTVALLPPAHIPTVAAAHNVPFHFVCLFLIWVKMSNKLSRGGFKT